MDGFFYAQSLYLVIEKPEPACFGDLENHFAPAVQPGAHPLNAPGVETYVALADILCRRMGDVEYYSMLVKDELAAKRGTVTAKLVGPLLVGHFGACKGVLDAGVIALARLYSLGVKSRRRELANKEMDFARQGKGSFWAVLASEQRSVHDRYARFQGT